MPNTKGPSPCVFVPLCFLGEMVYNHLHLKKLTEGE